jgi:hypothetical protein
MLATSIEHMKMILAAMIEAVFTVMGEPNNSVWQCPPAMDKWNKLVIGSRLISLGLIIDTNQLTVAIPIKYLTEVQALLDSAWHPNRRRFTVSKAQKLTGKLARLAERANWVFHLLSHLYSSIAYALAENTRLLMDSSQEFRDIILSIQTGAFFTSCKDLARHTSFAMQRVARLTHHSSYQYNINRTMRADIEFFCDNLKPKSDIKWETPIAHLIPQTPFATTIGDGPEGRSLYCLNLNCRAPPERFLQPDLTGWWRDV